LTTYQLTDINLFRVEIYDTPILEKIYKLIPIFEEEPFQHYIPIIEAITASFEFSFDPDNVLGEQIELLKNKSLFQLYRSFPGLSPDEKEIIARFAALNCLNFTKVYGLLADDKVEEYFLDSPSDFFYLDHAIFGRCRTNVHLNEKEIESFKTISKILSKKRLESSYPSLKYSQDLFDTQFRITIDVAPVNLNQFSITIRRARSQGWKLSELVKNNTLSLDIATFLLWCARNGINITVTGETDTGKTTLINAIDQLLPQNLRRIYIEDVKESLAKNDDSHQIFFQASDLEDNENKSHLIISLLHRSPDFVYLGEILTQSESNAMFHALNVGLRGFQTIHAQNIDNLINRWIYHHKINPILLDCLGVIVLMKKIGNERKIVEIAEILVNGETPVKEDIVNFNPVKNTWDFLKSFSNVHKVSEVLKYQNFGEQNLLSDLKCFEKIVLEN
jgi:Flp pilus assembly CpaF family ATPase